MRHRAQALRLKPVFTQGTQHIAQALCPVHKAEHAARAAQIRCRSADIIERAIGFRACRSLGFIRALPAAALGKIRRVCDDKVKFAGAKMLFYPTDIADNNASTPGKTVCGEIIPCSLGGLGVYLKSCHAKPCITA